MDILFKDDELQRLGSIEKLQRRKLGANGAKRLKRRLADLMAATRVTDLVAGRPHPLTGDRAGQFAVGLDGGRRLVFEPAVDPPPLREDRSIAWDRVTSVRIVYIGDYHD